MHIHNVICLLKIAYDDAVRSKCGIYNGMDARVIYTYKVSRNIFSENTTCLKGYPVTSNKKSIFGSSFSIDLL